VALRRLLIKSWLGLLAGDYAPYKIFCVELDEARPAPVDPEIELRTIEELEDTVVLGAFIDGERASACWIWWGERYRRERNFWPLKEGEAKLVHIETNPKFRGRGVAVALLRHAEWVMKQRGFTRMFARIWHNNEPSVRAFTKAGFKYEHFVLEIEPLRFGKRLRLSFKGRR
jgi:ribosomal protein S18 acetylase RimI-like enzyme